MKRESFVYSEVSLDGYLLITNPNDSVAELLNGYTKENEEEECYTKVSIFMDGEIWYICDIPRDVKLLKVIIENYKVNFVVGEEQVEVNSVLDLLQIYKGRSEVLCKDISQ